MLKIIQHGDQFARVQSPHAFRCPECYCLFETDNYTTMHAPRRQDSLESSNLLYLYCRCPDCGTACESIKFKDTPYLRYICTH